MTDEIVNGGRYIEMIKQVRSRSNLGLKPAKAIVDDFIAVWQEAMRRGREAAEACNVTPMVVEQHANMLDDSSPVMERWVCDSGVCGFAWVVVKPGTCSFARWLRKEGHAHKRDTGGVLIWISEYGQSYERKLAHARAMADYFREQGHNSFAQGRLD